MPVLLTTDFPFASRGVHPTIPGTPINVTAGNVTNMAAIDAVAAAMALSGTTNAGIMEFRQNTAASLSVPIGQVLTKLTVELVGRMTDPVLYTTDPLWTVELYDLRTGATLGGIAKQATIPISGALVSCFVGGLDTWGLTQAKILDVLSANSLRVRWTSPGWQSSSTGVLTIDGMRVSVESGLAPTAKRQVVRTRRTGTPGKIPNASEIDDGELVMNIADLRLFVGSGAQALDTMPIRRYAVTTLYLNGDITLYQGRFWVAIRNTGPGARVTGDWSEYAAAYALNAGLLNNLTPNQYYEMSNPFFMPHLWRGSLNDLTNYNNLLASVGFTARWWVCDGLSGRPNAFGRYPRQPYNEAQLGSATGGDTFSTTNNGDHAHSGSTGDTAISIAQMPAHNHDNGAFNQLMRVASGLVAADSGVTNANGILLRSSAGILPQGGNLGHHHSIGNDGTHGHAVTIDPFAINWWFIVRIA